MFSCLKTTGLAVFAFLVCSNLNAQDGPVAPVGVSVRELDAVTSRLRESLVKKLPVDLVFEQSDNWGHQAQVPSIQGIKPIYVLRNHGDWERAKVIAKDLPKNLQLRPRGASVTAGRIAVEFQAIMPATAELQKQVWQNGIEVFGSRLRARFELSADLHVEGDLAMGRIVNLEITHATISSGHFVTENVNGLGGDFARWVGGGATHFFKPWQPAVLGQYQKTVISAFTSVCDQNDTRGEFARLASRANLAHAVMVGLQQGGPTPSGPVQVAASACPESGLAPLIFFGGALFEFANNDHSKNAPPSSGEPRPPSTRLVELPYMAWGLVDHSYSYRSNSSSSGHSESTSHSGTNNHRETSGK